jgi:hypothetical protein
MSDSIRYNMSRDAKGNATVSSSLTVGGRRRPRTYSRASECISYYLDDAGNKVGATIFRESSASKRARAIKNIPTNRKLTAADLRPIFAD